MVTSVVGALRLVSGGNTIGFITTMRFPLRDDLGRGPLNLLPVAGVGRGNEKSQVILGRVAPARIRDP